MIRDIKRGKGHWITLCLLLILPLFTSRPTVYKVLHNIFIGLILDMKTMEVFHVEIFRLRFIFRIVNNSILC